MTVLREHLGSRAMRPLAKISGIYEGLVNAKRSGLRQLKCCGGPSNALTEYQAWLFQV